MASDGNPLQTPRSTSDLIAELRAEAASLTLAAIAVGFRDDTRFVFLSDSDPLARLNRLIRTGGTPVGVIGVRLVDGSVAYRVHPFAEFRDNPRAQRYLQSLRGPFLDLLQTHVNRMPDNPRYN